MKKDIIEISPEVKLKYRPFNYAFEVPVGINICNNDMTIHTQILSASTNGVYVYKGKEIEKITFNSLFKNWVIIKDSNLFIAGVLKSNDTIEVE